MVGTYFQPSSFSALSVDAYTAVASPGLLGHIFNGIFWKIKKSGWVDDSCERGEEDEK